MTQVVLRQQPSVNAAWQVPDVVINNAGIYPFSGLLEIDAALWDRVMAVNLRADHVCRVTELRRKMQSATPKGGR